MKNSGGHKTPTIQSRDDARYRGELTLSLSATAHTPRCILDMVQSLTNTPNLSRSLPKEEFLRLYDEFQRDTTDFFSGELLSWIVQVATADLDAYFFGRSLTYTPSTGGQAALEGPYIEGNIFEVNHIGYHVGCRYYAGQKNPNVRNLNGLTSGKTPTIIYIDAFKKGVPRTIKSIFETLVHEMAHAIFRSYGCECNRCRGSGSEQDSIGPDGHGLPWVELMIHMRSEIQTWHEDLADFISMDDIWRHYHKYH